MQDESISSDVKRFILTSIDSIPHLEAILLLRQDPDIEWDSKMIAPRLYISETKANDLLADLHTAGFAAIRGNHLYQYQPITNELKEMVSRLAYIYAKNLIEVTHLIHDKTARQAKQFGDAFKWQKERND
jgi:hypothetical protein